MAEIYFQEKKHMVYKFWASETGEREGNKGKELAKDKKEHKREKSSAAYQGKVMRFTSSSKETDFQRG